MTIGKDGKLNQTEVISNLMNTINHLNELLKLRDNEILDLKLKVYGDVKSSDQSGSK